MSRLNTFLDVLRRTPVAFLDWPRHGLILLVGTACLLRTGFPAHAAEMTMDLAQRGGALKKAGLGSLFGVSAVAGGTSDYYLTNSLRYVAQSQGRIGENGSNPYSTEAVAPVLQGTDATMMCRFNDLLYNWLYDWSGYEFWMTQVTNASWAVTTNYPGVVYAIAPFNEPDTTMNNPEFNNDPLLQGSTYDEKINWLWTQTVQAIRSINPTVQIMGPNYWQYYPWIASHQERMSNFLQNAISTGTVPDIIGWHSLGPSPGDVPEALTVYYRPLEAQLNVPGRPLPVSVEEYGPDTGDFEGVPGTMIKHWAEFERYGIDYAAMGIYNNGGSLGNTLRYFWEAEPQPNGGWHMMNWYNLMQGEYVPVSRWDTRYYQAFDGVASYQPAGKVLTLLLGGSDDSADVRITGMDTAGYGNAVRVRVDMTLWTVDEHAAETAPERHGDPQTGTYNLSDKIMTYTGTELTVPVRRIEGDHGYRVQVMPVSPPATYSTKHEAETATLNNVEVIGGASGKVLASGDAYVGFIDYPDSSLTFHVNAPATGFYQMLVRYANGYGLPASHHIHVNGQAQGDVGYETTVGWGNSEMRTVRKRVALVEGNNHIRFTRGTNYTELDFIDVRPDTHRYEAEYAVVNHAVAYQYNYAFMLPTHIGGIDHADSHVEFSVEAPANGIYTLRVAYANGTGGNSTHQLIVNGIVQGSVPYLPSGGWLGAPDPRVTRRQVEVNVALNAGLNTIRLLKGSGYAELDYVILKPTATTVPRIPKLEIALTSPTSATLAWLAPATGYSLRWSPQLPANQWFVVTNPVSEAGGFKQATVPTIPVNRFFRLTP